jgi:hypothetical protein
MGGKFSDQLSVISGQLSVVSYQEFDLLAISL